MKASALLVILVACCPIAFAAIDAASLDQRVKTDGARLVVDQLYKQPSNWESVRRHISHGEARWVGLGSRLYVEADAGPKEMLAESLAEALERAPANVLELARKHMVRTDELCIGPDVDDPRYAS